jgi:hypothetical protein
MQLNKWLNGAYTKNMHSAYEDADNNSVIKGNIRNGALSWGRRKGLV